MKKYKEALFQFLCHLNFKYYDVHWPLGCEYALFRALRTGVYGGYILEPKEVRRLRFYYILSAFSWFHLPDFSEDIAPIGFREWRTLRSLRPTATLLPRESGIFLKD